jgi:L-threonylcarbamoyladenylate synthase
MYNRINIPQLPQEEVIRTACEVLAAGGLLIFPTETTYGAGVDATNQEAVNKLLAYKSRREGKPLSIAVTDQAMAELYVEVNDSAKRIYERFLPGPVTVVSKSKGVVADGVASEYGTLGIRIPAYPLILEIVKAYGKPITATSANGSGEKRPYTIQDILDGLSEKQKSLLDLVLDAGELPKNPPSTVIDTTLETPVIFRQGDVTVAGADDAKSAHYTSHSEGETQEIAQRVMLNHWEDVKSKGVFIALHGSLGAGKTIFVKGVAQFLGITETLTSPTYVYMQQYDFHRHGITGQLHHLDLWRMEHPEMIDRLGIEELLGPKNVVAIEWPSLASKALKQLVQKHGVTYISVQLEEKDDSRRITCQTLS